MQAETETGFEDIPACDRTNDVRLNLDAGQNGVCQG